MLEQLSKPLIFVAFVSVCLRAPGAIYETDDRYDAKDYLHLSETKTAVQSIALVTDKSLLLPTRPLQYRLETLSLEDYEASIEEPLCPEERFRDQPVVYKKAGTGFLIGPDLLVTAGHVIGTQSICEKKAFIFDYALDHQGRDPRIVDEQNVVYCEKLLLVFSIRKWQKPIKEIKCTSCTITLRAMNLYNKCVLL